MRKHLRSTTVLAGALLAPAALVAQSFGTSCGGNGGTPTVDIAPAMRPGFASTMTISNLPVNRAALLMMGSSRTSWGPAALALSLSPLGMPGCELLVGPEVSVPFG